jgi:hypothetical protein
MTFQFFFHISISLVSFSREETILEQKLFLRKVFIGYIILSFFLKSPPATSRSRSFTGETSPIVVKIRSWVGANVHRLVMSFMIFTQGCQMVYFPTKNTNLNQFLRASDWMMLIHFMAIWNIRRTF